MKHQFQHGVCVNCGLKASSGRFRDPCVVVDVLTDEPTKVAATPSPTSRGVPLNELPERDAAYSVETNDSKTPFTQPLSDFARKVAEKSRAVRDFETHAGRYYCEHCKAWVSPFFDSVDVAGPGFAMTNDQGMTMFRTTKTSEKRVRCKECGSAVHVSAEHMRDKTLKELRAAEKRLEDERSVEENWLKGHQDQKLWQAEQAVRDAKLRRRWFRSSIVWTLETGCLAWWNWAHTGRVINTWSIATFLFFALSITLGIWETPKRNSGLLTLLVLLSFVAFAVTFFIQAMYLADY